MSGILEFIINIFAFEDPMASLVFYLALIVIPGTTLFLGKKMPDVGTKIIGWVFKGVAVVIGVAGIILLVMISQSSKPLELSKSLEVNGKQIEAIDVRASNEGSWIVQDGRFFEPTNVNEEAFYKAKEENPDEYLEQEGVFYRAEDIPDNENVTKLYLEDGSTFKVVGGYFWDQSTVGTAIQLAMIIIYICFGLMLGYGLSNIIESPRRAISPLIVIGALLLIFVIGYQVQGSMFSDLSNDFLAKMSERGSAVTAQDEADAGGGMVITFTLVGLAVVAWIGGEIYKLVK